MCSETFHVPGADGVMSYGHKTEPSRGKDEAALRSVDGEKNHWQEEDRVRYHSEKISLRTSDEVESIRLFSRTPYLLHILTGKLKK